MIAFHANALDVMLTRTIEVDAGGWITLFEEPGLGIEPDEDVLERTLSHQATFVQRPQRKAGASWPARPISN